MTIGDTRKPPSVTATISAPTSPSLRSSHGSRFANASGTAETTPATRIAAATTWKACTPAPVGHGA